MKQYIYKAARLLLFFKDWKLVRKSTYHQKQKLFELVEASKDVIYYYQVKPERKCTYVSPSLDSFLGEGYVKASYEDPLLPLRIIHPEDVEVVVGKAYGGVDYSKGLIQRWKDENGVYRWFEEHTIPIYHKGEIVEIAGVIRNIDEKVKIQNELEYRVNHDALTGLYNREFFEKKMTFYEEKEEVNAGILLFDLDELKHMNDTYGHKVGDELIKRMAQLLEDTFPDDTIARVGGDEFVVLMKGKDKDYIEEKCRILNDKAGPVSFSAGYGGPSPSTGSMQRMFTEADHRMYEKKKRKKVRSSFLNPAMEEDIKGEWPSQYVKAFPREKP